MTSGPALAPVIVRPAPGRRTAVRTDIQGLRAVAVVLVVVFHLWPGRLTGGYVGVDVFFVLSGFLITSHLLRKPVLGVSDLLEFWARRVRRLIPAASVVLLATTAAAAVWLPAGVRASLGWDVASAAAYVSNWRFATSETDYLAAGQLPSAVQHFWSLSIEEQFYALWPALLGVATVLAVAWAKRGRRLGSASPSAAEQRRAASPVVLGVVAATVAVSLAWSVWSTHVDPAPAYFVSTTRVWELALGGLLAAVPAAATVRLRVSPAARAVTAWLGLAMVAAAAVTFDDATAFPGAAALLPTLGTLLVVAADADDARLGPGRVLATRPVQWLGDHSYAIYLWHWPLVVVVPFALRRPLTGADVVGVVVATLVLAALSRHFVEERLRWHRRLVGSRRATFTLLAACALVGAGAGVGLTLGAHADQRAAFAEAQAAIAAADPCVGAGVALTPGCADPGMLMTPDLAADDKPAVYADGCWNNTPFTSRNTCRYGAGTGAGGRVDAGTEPGAAAARIALVGNSHAGHWLPALQDALVTHDWQLTTYLQSVCYTVDAPLAFPGAQESAGCQAVNRWAVSSVVDGGYDLVVMSDRTDQPLAGVARQDQDRAAQDAYRATLDRFTSAGLPVLVLRDTPAMSGNVPDCLALHGSDAQACAAPRDTAVEPDPLAAAALADASGLVSVLDVNDLLCDAQRCHAVVGGLVTHFDHGHLTASFARTLAPEVVGAVERALADHPR
ncbi:acyltransferase family protein [Xylanimonas protaetiae]|uniref:Acyltransferase n=1 Tax=Xylanimonas protaetiae TaxID=2509457 RepID=A0A4P6F2H4_9MICO|nr:acyltransferase family protein [Xylanimonas protaetiae]QAY69365.1 acyltransferase [Xylanimonas protaetiae]